MTTQTTTEEILAALRGSYPPGPPRHILLKAADKIEALTKHKQAMEGREHKDEVQRRIEAHQARIHLED